jgi:plasmid stabilization system protein ParE
MKRREIRFAVGADEDLVRLYRFLADKDPAAAKGALTTIRQALTLAAAFPFSCRKVGRRSWLRECVIPFSDTGYVAAFEIAEDHIMVLAVRHQREDDYH